MKITFLINNKKSWLWQYIDDFKKMLEAKGHLVTVIDDHKKMIHNDICFFLSCKYIVPKDYLKYHDHNFVIHHSDLPKGRGFAPLVWNIVEGLNRIPFCLFEAEEEVDVGDIYLKKYLELDGSELLDEILKKRWNLEQNMILTIVDKYPNIKGVKQRGTPTFNRKRCYKDDEISVNSTIAEVFNQLRIKDNEGWPAYFYYKGYKYTLKIYKDEKVNSEQSGSGLKDDVFQLKKWLETYSNGFLNSDLDNDFNIKLKISHIKKVRENILYLSQKLGLNNNQLRLLEAAVLLHDAGRFEQYRKHKTFSDKNSENHALISLRIIDGNKLLDNFNQSEAEIIKKVIYNHNLFELAADTEEILFLSRILRDADKLDILLYLDDLEAQSNRIQELGLLPSLKASKEVLDDFFIAKVINYKKVKNIADYYLAQISWIFDLNFPVAYQYMLDNKIYLDIFIKILSQIADSHRINLFLEKYIRDKAISE